MLSPEQRTEGELLLDRIEQRPPGLTMGIRLCLSDPKHGWLTPVEVRNYLFEIRFGLENYTSNPLASIHTTLKRMVPDEVEVKGTPERRQGIPAETRSPSKGGTGAGCGRARHAGIAGQDGIALSLPAGTRSR